MTRTSPSNLSKAKQRSKTTENKVPTNKKSKQCPICFRFFFSFLPRHMEQHSEDEKPYPCTFSGCDYATYQRSNLKTHLAVHIGKTVPCPEPGCDFECVDQSYLIRHKKDAHNYVPRPRAMPDQTAPFVPPSPPLDSDQQQQQQPEPQKPNKRGRPKGSGKRLKESKARVPSPDLSPPHSPPVQVQYKYPEAPPLSPPHSHPPSLQPPFSPSYNPGSLGVYGVSPAVPNPGSVSLPQVDGFESDFTSNQNMNTEYTSTPSSYLLESSPSEVLAGSPLHMNTGLEPGSGMSPEAYYAVSNGAPSMVNGMFLNQGLAYGVGGSLSPDSSSELGSSVYMGMGANLDEGIRMGTSMGMGFGMGVDNSLALSPVSPIPLQLPHGSIGERLSASLDPSSIEAPGFRFDSYHSYFLPAIGSDASQSHVPQPMGLGMGMGNVPTQSPYYEPAGLYLPQDNNLYDQTPGAGPSNWLTRGPFY